MGHMGVSFVVDRRECRAYFYTTFKIHAPNACHFYMCRSVYAAW